MLHLYATHLYLVDYWRHFQVIQFLENLSRVGTQDVVVRFHQSFSLGLYDFLVKFLGFEKKLLCNQLNLDKSDPVFPHLNLEINQY